MSRHASQSRSGKVLMTIEEAVNPNDPVPGGHDKKFAKWALKAPTAKGYATKDKTIEVFAHPEGGQRAARCVGFTAQYDGVGFFDTDIVRLSERLEAYHLQIREDDFEKVLIIETDSRLKYGGRYGDSFGLSWRIGWHNKRLGFVFDEERRHKLSDVYVSEYDLADPLEELKGVWPDACGNETKESQDTSGFRIGNPDERTEAMDKMAVIPWTEEREAALQAAADKLNKLREGLRAALKEDDMFAKLLDTSGAKLLESGLDKD